MNSAATASAFSPQTQGTPEAVWERLLSARATWSPPPGPLWVVSPHPDDETLGAGGLIRSWASAGHPVLVVSVTDGEAAYPHWPTLARLRQLELKSALRGLAMRRVTLIRLGIPDGQVRSHQRRLHRLLSSLIEPDCTLVAPFEHDGHPDHDAAGEVCVRLARMRGLRLARYLVWRWHHGDPRPLFDARWGRFPLSIDTQRAKSLALRCFVTQLHPAQGEPVIPDHVRRYFERPFEPFML